MNTEKIFNAVAELREAAGNGPRMRKLLDALFRHVHNLKANASANGLNSLATAVHEFENVLYSMRTGSTGTIVSNAIPAEIWNSLKREQKHTLQQSVAEGARLFLVEANFDVTDFDREFQNLKETLSQTGEVISTSPRIGNDWPGKVNFRILYTQKGEAALTNTSEITIEEISSPLTANSPKTPNDLDAFERAFEKLSAELINLPESSVEGVFQQAVRAGQAAALVTGKEVDFELRGEDLDLNKRFTVPLIHLVRNAVDHGIESSDERVKLGKNPRGKIVIEAVALDGQIKITVTDDGRGIPPSLIRQIFQSGFSTAPQVTEISGRGVGLDAVESEIKEAGGSISVKSEVGYGSCFEITLPS
jgi:chemotaxis protein histidine kinase CheA